MKLFRRWYWLISSFVKKYFWGIAAGMLAGIILYFNAPLIFRFFPVKNTIHIGRIGLITLQELPLDIQTQISRGLTKTLLNGEVVLDIAQTISVSDDGKTYALTLRPDVFWSNGSRVISTDIDLQIPDVVISYPTNESIVFTLEEAFSPFTTILTQPLLKRVTVGTLFKKVVIMGTNQYQVNQIKLRSQFIDTLTVSSKSENFIYHFYATESDALIAFKLGHIDRIDHLSTYVEFKDNQTQVTTEEQNFRYLALFYNMAQQSLQDKSVRQLLTYAIPKPQGESRVISPLPKTSWAYNPQVKPYHTSLTTSQEMLAKLQAANPAFSLSIELTTTPAYIKEADLIKTSWQSLGVEVKVKVVPYPDMNDYQVVLIGQQVPQDPDQYSLWHSTQNTNITKYQSPKIDKLLEDGRKETNLEKRKAIYMDFQRFLVEDCPAAFIQRLDTYQLKRL